jgi:hypothetical protein
MWITLPAGVALFLLGQLGARTGAVTLPFDPHHIGAQVVGALLVLYGLMHWK